MRLPADATLIVVDMQEAIDDPRWGPRNNPDAENNIARLIARWRMEGLPLVHIRHDFGEPGSPYAPGAPGHRFKACAAPRDGERVVGKSANSAFIRPGPRGRARRHRGDDAGDLRRADVELGRGDGAPRRQPRLPDVRGRRRVLGGRQARPPGQSAGRRRTCTRSHSPIFTGEYATVVDTEAALQAAATAKARQRRQGDDRKIASPPTLGVDRWVGVSVHANPVFEFAGKPSFARRGFDPLASRLERPTVG